MRKPDKILSYHLNPAFCGVAKFNKILGEKLGIPVDLLDVVDWGYPLISIKPSELLFEDECDLIDKAKHENGYQLFLHGIGLPDTFIAKADRVYAANVDIASHCDMIRCDVVSAWCPSLIKGEPSGPSTGVELNVFSFGMAHKIQAEYYAKLDKELKETGKSYQLLLSTAFHEGFDVEAEWGEAADEIRKAFSGPVRFLGCLSDTAIWSFLKKCDYFAAFFPGGFRENNTSINTAIESGIKVVTNCDEFSPAELVQDKNGVTILDRIYKARSWDELVILLGGKYG